jgi:multidrug efflux pump subunit AcrA (membrane-fusion protein)
VPPLVAGARVEREQAIFTLSPIVSPESRFALTNAGIEAKGRVEIAQSEVTAARLAKTRAEQLLRDKAGSAQSAEDSRLRLELAERRLAAAVALDRAATLVLEADEGVGLAPITLRAPEPGVLWNLGARTGQFVAAGTVLFEVVNLETLWIRVPVHAGELFSIDREHSARVAVLSTEVPSNIALAVEAKPVDAPPTASSLASTVDLVYEVNSGAFRPDQRVEARLPLKEFEKALVVPWSAILFDIHGGAWVYESEGTHRFTRRLVELGHVVGPLAALRKGPEEGTLVVSAGAAELFGTEFGAGK